MYHIYRKFHQFTHTEPGLFDDVSAHNKQGVASLVRKKVCGKHMAETTQHVANCFGFFLFYYFDNFHSSCTTKLEIHCQHTSTQPVVPT